jgi:hypothetical protein
MMTLAEQISEIVQALPSEQSIAILGQLINWFFWYTGRAIIKA